MNVTSGTIEVQIDLYRADRTYLGTRSGDDTRLRGFEFRQITEIMKPYGTIADGYAVIRTTTPGGRFLAFATVIDNHVSGDPVFMPAAQSRSGGARADPDGHAHADPSGGRAAEPPDLQAGGLAELRRLQLRGQLLPAVVGPPLRIPAHRRDVRAREHRDGEAHRPRRFGFSLDGVLKVTAT